MSDSYRVWGWGEPADVPTPESLRALVPTLAAAAGVTAQEPQAPAALPACRRRDA